MSLKARLSEDARSALKNRDRVRLGLIRMIRAQIKNREISKQRDLTDEEVVEVVSSLIKTRRESRNFALQGGRTELVEQADQELSILATYLPTQLSDDEIRDIIREAIDQTGASGPKDIGRVMGSIMPRVKGRADGRLVSDIVRECLVA